MGEYFLSDFHLKGQDSNIHIYIYGKNILGAPVLCKLFYLIIILEFLLLKSNSDENHIHIN